MKRETVLKGCSIVCTLHQPSSHLFKLFDKVICLSDGHTIYNGPVADIKSYFSRNLNLELPLYCNPADYLLKVATDPTIVDAKLSRERLIELCDKEYKAYLSREMK